MSLLRYICLWCIPYTVILAAGSTIQGHITDSKSGEPLIGANIMLLETVLGSASDENGAYMITNIPIVIFLPKPLRRIEVDIGKFIRVGR